VSGVNAKTWLTCWVAVLCGGCGTSPAPAERSPLTDTVTTERAAPDTELEECRKRIAAVEREPALPGATELDARRGEILGRARGEALLLVREPRALPDGELAEPLLSTRRALSSKTPHERVRSVKSRHARDPSSLRALLLREGYVYSNDPIEALALADSSCRSCSWSRRSFSSVARRRTGSVASTESLPNTVTWTGRARVNAPSCCSETGWPRARARWASRCIAI
jgi:hypothetical protein